MHVSGAYDFGWSGVQDLHSDGEQETGSEGHAFSQTLIQVLVLVHQSVLTGGTVHVDPSWPQGGQEPWRRWSIQLFLNIWHFWQFYFNSIVSSSCASNTRSLYPPRFNKTETEKVKKHKHTADKSITFADDNRNTRQSQIIERQVTQSLLGFRVYIFIQTT